MWKKILVLCIALAGTLSVGYAMLSNQIDAAPSAAAKYYKSWYNAQGGAERNGSATHFKMGGEDWWFAYEDNGTMYISSTTGAEKNCALKSSGQPNATEVESCIPQARQHFSQNLNDDDELGKLIFNNSANGLNSATPVMLDYNLYNKLSQNETDFNSLSGLVWLDEKYNGYRVAFTKGPGGYNQRYKLPNYKNLFTSQTVNQANLTFFFAIQTPQYNMVDSISAAMKINTISYGNGQNAANEIVAEIDTNNGEGPYHFFVHDTDVSGSSGNYLSPSQYFAITEFSNNGKATVTMKNKLPIGDYYFRVTVRDESTNQLLYYQPDNMNADKFRRKETGILHVKIIKEKPTIAFDNKNDTKKTAAEAATNWNETATANPNNSDVKVTYSKVGGDIGLINIDPDTGEITYTGNVTFGKVKIRATADDDPVTGNDNYDAVYAEKEIIIAQELDGEVEPHANSTDKTVPTFKASDANVQSGGVIATIKGTQGTPDNLKSGTITYTYGLKSGDDSSLFSVNTSTGVITSNANLAVGSYHITVTLIDKWNTTPKEIPVTINVGVAPAEELKFYENKTSNTVINQKKVKFTDTNVSVFATVKGSTNSNTVKYKIKDGSSNVITVHATSGAVTIKGAGTVIVVAEKKGASGQADATAELEFIVEAAEQNFIYTTDSTLSKERPKTGEKYTTLKETYAPSKTFNVYTTGNPTGSTVTYKLKNGSPTDVISVDPNGTIHILNASLPAQIGKVIVQATSHDPSGSYEDKTIELPIDIEKGTRKVEFAGNPINVVSGSGSVNPEILVDGSLDTSGNAVIEVDPNANDIAWTNDGVKIEYEWENEEPKDVNIQVTKPADRNYREATGTGILHILGAEENTLTLSTPGKVTYGDHFAIRSTQDDSMSTNVQYTFETDNGVFISAPQVNGNRAEFDALAYSGSTEITITVTRTADGELPLSKKVKVKVLPKPITIEIHDKEKKRLEENPELTYKDFKRQLVEWNGVRDTINESVIKLSTTAGKYSPTGTYPIIAKNAQKQLNDNYPNYTFTIKDGKLNIKDNGDKNFWDIDDDGCPDLNINLTDDQGNAIIINGDKNEDGIPDYNIDTNGDGKPDLNIDTDNDGRPDVNLVILKEWKPNKCVEIDGIKYSSGINAKPEINIDLDGDNIPDINIDNKGDFKPHINISKDGKTPSVNITTLHGWTPKKDYKKGSFLYDSIGTDSNDPKPELNIDSDGDGLPDINLDLDGDGSADINIDSDGDWIPDLNIDSTGDGKPDINVDISGNGYPEENIREITEWKPGHNVDGEFPYDTMTFDDPEPEEPNTPPEPSDQDPTDVDGAYYPGDNMGGALTGDTTNMMIYMGLGCMSIGMMLFILFKRKQEE